MSVTHVAGPVVHIVTEGRIIQRCAVCGEKLADNFECTAPLNPDGSQPSFLTWKERHYVHVDGNRHFAGDCFTNSKDPLPIDFCLELVE